MAQASQDILDEVPLWDYRALLQVFSQFQEIRLYYAFTDVAPGTYRARIPFNPAVDEARALIANAPTAISVSRTTERHRTSGPYRLVGEPECFGRDDIARDHLLGRKARLDALDLADVAFFDRYIVTGRGVQIDGRERSGNVERNTVTLGEDGTILYCNRRFAEMVRSRLEKVYD